MKDEIKVGAIETAVLEVLDLNGSNITNCTCTLLESNIWYPGGLRGENIPNPEIGVKYKMISEVIPMGYGINWKVRSVEKIK